MEDFFMGKNTFTNGKNQYIPEALLQSEKDLREAQRLAHIGSWKWIALTDMVTWSEELYHINGRDPESPVPGYTEMSSCYTTESWERLSAAVEKAMQTGESYELDLEIIRPDGVKRHTFARGEPDYDTNGKIAGLHGTVQDITERKQTENALNALSLRHKAILEAVPEIIMEVDNNKVYTWANQLGLDFFGENVVGKEAASYFEGEQNMYIELQPLFKGVENVFYVESWQRRKDGQKRLLAWWCRGLKDENMNVTGAISSARDITDQIQVLKKIQEQLSELKRWQQVMVNREDRIMELKHEVNDLCRRINEPVRYPSQEGDVS